MDKPTTPKPAYLGLLVPETEEHRRVQELIETVRKAMQADPESMREDQRRNADLQAAYDRLGGRSPFDAGRQEELIRDARKYAESYLADAQSPEERLIVSRRIWDEFIPKHPNREAFALQFSALHKAIWTEGCPSLEERANDRGVSCLGLPNDQLPGRHDDARAGPVPGGSETAIEAVSQCVGTASPGATPCGLEKGSDEAETAAGVARPGFTRKGAGPMNLTSEQRELLVVIVDRHRSAGGRPFLFMISNAGTGFCGEGSQAPPATSEADFRQLYSERLITWKGPATTLFEVSQHNSGLPRRLR
jgi:hypothetical protein